MSDTELSYDGCSIPPEIYAGGMGWDPRPEVERLLFLAREAGVQVRTALELGCGTGRLLAPLAGRVEHIVGVELNPQMAATAQQAVAAGFADRVRILTGDMCDLVLDERFDLIFTSPNTLRHVLDDAAIERFWRGVAEHLNPGGVFIGDLELGISHEQRALARPQFWAVECEDALIEVHWEVIRVPSIASARTRIRWTFVSRRGEAVQRWWEEFELRAFEIEDLLAGALRAGRLALVGVYENRDPYLLPREPHELNGRFIVVLTRPP